LLPETHPLHRKIKRARTFPLTTHLSPLDYLVKIFELAKTKIETISPITDNPYKQALFKTVIYGTRESSIEEERRDELDFKIFTDGSDHDREVGAATVMYKKGLPAPTSHLKAYLGLSTKHNNYKAEVVGGILATWLVTQSPIAHGKRVYIYTDNQSFIRTATCPKASPGQYLLQNFNREANNSRAKLELRWISRHSNVQGNEKADRLAKEAVMGQANRREELPPILQRNLPTSVSSKNREHMVQLKNEWKTLWQDSPRREREQQDKLSRAHASLLLQVRSGHLSLNTYLYRIKKAD